MGRIASGIAPGPEEELKIDPADFKAVVPDADYSRKIKEKGAGWKLAGGRHDTVMAYQQALNGTPEMTMPAAAWKNHIEVAHGEAQEVSSNSWCQARIAGCTFKELLDAITIEIEATRIGWDRYFRNTKTVKAAAMELP